MRCWEVLQKRPMQSSYPCESKVFAGPGGRPVSAEIGKKKKVRSPMRGSPELLTSDLG